MCFIFSQIVKLKAFLVSLSVAVIIVPHSESGIVPRSSLLGAGQLGFREFGKGGTIG
jgi:hypothetical protein